MKRILHIIGLDLALSRRNSIAVYSLVSPLILAVLVRLIIPSISGENYTVAVHESVPQIVVDKIASYGEIVRYSSFREFSERVERTDDVAGFYMKDGYLTLLLEGNEGQEFENRFSLILSDISVNQLPARFVWTDLGNEPAPIRGYAAAMLMMLSLFIGGLIVGFTIVEEKESKMTRALAVSPITMPEFLTARSFLAVIIGILGGILSTFIIMGGSVSYPLLLASACCSLLVALPFGFIIGAFSENQMTAFALVKLLMALFLTLPFISIFVPQRLLWPFRLFPNYWMFRSMADVIVGTPNEPYWLVLLLTAVTGCGLILALLPRLRKGLNFR